MILNISQVLQERMPGWHRCKVRLNKFYFLLALLSFGLSGFAFYTYFSTTRVTFQPFKNETDLNEIINSQNVQEEVAQLNQAGVLFPANNFFTEIESFNEAKNVNQPILLGDLNISKPKSLVFSINFPKFAQSNSLYYKNKSKDQFEKQQDDWKDLNKIKNIPVTEDGKIIYPAGLIADTFPFDRIVLLNENNEIFESETQNKNKIDGKKVVIQDITEDLVLPLSWNINNVENLSSNERIANETVLSADGQSFLPKEFIKDSKLLEWMSIGSFPGNRINIGKIDDLQPGNYKIFLLDYDINLNYLENDVLRDRKFKIEQKKVVAVNSLSLPIFLIINGAIMTCLAVFL